MKNISIFCSISTGEIEKVNKFLIPSLLKQKGFDKINLFLINYKGDGIIFTGMKKYENLIIKEISNGKKLGFGEAHNFAFNQIKPDPYFLIINPDVYLQEDCVLEMTQKMENDKMIGIVEARQLPFEHPKEYDKKTGKTPWASGFGILIRSELFIKIGGFDSNYWMYCEDVDLSWRAWINGYKVIYDPKAAAYHFTGSYFEYSDDKFNIEQLWGARNFLYIAYKFLGNAGEIKARYLLSQTNYPEYFKKEVLVLFENLKKSLTTNFYKENENEIKKLKNIIKIVAFNQYHDIK